MYTVSMPKNRNKLIQDLTDFPTKKNYDFAFLILEFKLSNKISKIIY